MAFGKKKQQDEAPAIPAPEAAPDEQPEEEQLAEAAPPGAADAAPQADAAAPETSAADSAADPLAGDLLNMFQTTKIEAEDLSLILELAGEAEMDDLLEELHTVALALGCQLEEVSADEMLAA